jgi:predicted ATPase
MAATEMSERVLAFGQFRLFPDRQELLSGERLVPLGTPAFRILVALAERPGELLGKDELMARVWPGSLVDEANLRVQVATLRKALGDDSGEPAFIRSVIGRGYCFVAAVERIDGRPRAVPTVEAVCPPRLPPRPARLIGRDETIAALAGQLQQHRLVTIVGPGGIGKTTVGLAVANAVAEGYPGGVSFVDLAPAGDASLLVPLLASAIGLPMQGEPLLVEVIAFLRGRTALLVLDNCEQLVEPVAALAEGILTGAAAVHLIVTSREPLRVRGERVHRLESLRSPPSAEGLSLSEVLQYSAVRLFVERAKASWDTFAPTDADVPLLATICRRLDGIPLALELAAGRIDSLGLRTMAEHLNGRYSLIMRGRRTAMPRHQTLRAMLDSSYDALPEHERVLMRRLGVFNTAITLEALQALADGMQLSPSEVTEVVSSLVSKSLLGSDVGGSVTRYRLLETTRIYALEKLREAGEDAAAHRLHADFVLRALRALASADTDRATTEVLPTAEQLQMELRAALDWALSCGETTLAAQLTAAAGSLQTLRSPHEMVRPSVRPARGLDEGNVDADVTRGVVVSLRPARSQSGGGPDAVTSLTAAGGSDPREKRLRLLGEP